jgi:hypothetical protein
MNLVQTTVILVSCCALVMLIGLAAALAMVATSPLVNRVPKDVFGFASLQTNPQSAPPSLTRYAARDGEQLAYRFYDSTSDQILIFVHGSSYHGASYHALASMISSSGVSKVVLPNLRGHFQSGRRRGDVDYVGQLEDDIADLVQCLRKRNLQGRIRDPFQRWCLCSPHIAISDAEPNHSGIASHSRWIVWRLGESSHAPTSRVAYPQLSRNSRIQWTQCDRIQ